MAFMTISGIEKVKKALKNELYRIADRELGKAATKAMDVLGNAVSARTPVRTGELKAALVKHVHVDTRKGTVEADVGFSGKHAMIADAVEYGHNIVTHRPELKTVGFASAHPFMRPAFDASKEQAVEAFAASIAESMGR